MIVLDDARFPPTPSQWRSPGGFAWWYLELLDDTTSGLIAIWSFGLPFLPGQASSVRRDDAQLPDRRPSLNLCLYDHGRLVVYCLREFSPEEAHWDGAGAWNFGDTYITQVDNGGTRSVHLEISCPVSGSDTPIAGTVVVTGPVPQRNGADLGLGDSPHAWTPQLGVAWGCVALRAGDFKLRTHGRVYHDRNVSSVGLDRLGIVTWLWGRAAMPDCDRIFYGLWPQEGGGPVVRGVEVDREGHVTVIQDLTFELGGAHRTAFGMTGARSVTLRQGDSEWLHLDLSRRVDHGPFYLRYLPKARAGETAALGASAEIIVPSRVDMGLHRPFVRMRVASGHRNSPWLPLFDGWRGDRWSRLLRHLSGHKPASQGRSAGGRDA